MEYMVQCLLRKNKGTFTQRDYSMQTAWLDEKPGLKVGAVVEIKSEVEGDQQGWEVVEVGTRLPKEVVHERSRDFANTRKASDI